MEPPTDKHYIRIRKNVAITLLLVIAASVLGWWFGGSDTPRSTLDTNTSTPNVSQTESSAGSLKDIASYTLPDGWKQVACEGNESIFVVPNGAPSSCDSTPISPVKMSVDPSNTTDCNQLQNQSEVKKHICISQYINGSKSLKATTEYLTSSSYKQATTMHSYYVNTGKGVVKAEYVYTTNNQYQVGFDQLVASIKAK